MRVFRSEIIGDFGQWQRGGDSLVNCQFSRF